MDEVEQQIQRPSRPLLFGHEMEIKLAPAWKDGKPDESKHPLWRKRDVGVSTDASPMRRREKQSVKEGDEEAPPQSSQ